jgi:hypothetical protein
MCGPQMLAARPWAGAEWPRQRTTRMVRPIVPGSFSMAQNAHFGESIGIRRATDYIGGYRLPRRRGRITESDGKTVVPDAWPPDNPACPG